MTRRDGEDDDLLDRLAAAIADGQPIDWKAETLRRPDLAWMFEELRVIETAGKTLQRSNAGRIVTVHEGAFVAYLMRIAKEVERDAGRQGSFAYADLQRYQEAKAALDEDLKAALVMRLERDCSFEQMAPPLSLPTAEEARIVFKRALERLVKEMHERSSRRRRRS